MLIFPDRPFLHWRYLLWGNFYLLELWNNSPALQVPLSRSNATLACVLDDRRLFTQICSPSDTFLSHMVTRKTVRLEGWKRKSSNALLGKANRCLQGAREAHRGAVAHGSCVQQQFVSGVADVWTGKGSAGSWLQVCSPGFSSPLFPALPSQCPSIIVRCLAKGLGASRQEFDGKRQTASNRT